jgi:hypothetical protein
MKGVILDAHALGEAYTNYNRALDEALERGYNMSRLGLAVAA